MSAGLTGSVKNQEGMVLLISLVVLAVVSVVSASLMDNAVKEKRMASKMIEHSGMMQSAELGLDEAEMWLSRQVTIPELAEQVTEEKDIWLTQDLQVETDRLWWAEHDSEWWLSHAEVSLSDFTGSVETYYILEQLDRIPNSESEEIEPELVFYRITVRSSFRQNNAAVFLQSTFSRYLFSPDIAVNSDMNEEQLLDRINLKEAGDITGRLSWRRLQNF